jgi:hypothetical protein
MSELFIHLSYQFGQVSDFFQVHGKRFLRVCVLSLQGGLHGCDLWDRLCRVSSMLYAVHVSG